jgi:Transposase, Mutator family
MLTVIPSAGDRDSAGSSSLIDEIVREGARRMLAEALQAEVDAYIAAHSAERGEDGRRVVVRNGCHQPREVLTSAGAVQVMAPRVNDRRTDPATGERMRFSSAILPPWCRKTPEDHRGASPGFHPPLRAVRGQAGRPSSRTSFREGPGKSP